MIARNRLEDHAGLFGQEYEGRKVEMPERREREARPALWLAAAVAIGYAIVRLLGR